MPLRLNRPPSWSQFVAWAGCGASAIFILVGAFAYGPLAVVPAVLFAGAALVLGGANGSAVGSAAGVGAWAFVLGWLNRDGPGMVCSSAAGTCNQEWAPWPFWLAGVLFVVVPVIVFVHLRRESRRTPAA